MAKELKSLKKHNEEAMKNHSFDNGEPVKNGIACPECGEEMVDTDPLVVLTSLPPKKNVGCQTCGYRGYRVM